MSKPGEPTERVGPDEQIKIFLDVYRDVAKPAVVARLTARVRELSLTFTEDELVILAALDTPARVRVPQHAGLLQQRSRRVSCCRPDWRTALKARCLLTPRTICTATIRVWFCWKPARTRITTLSFFRTRTPACMAATRIHAIHASMVAPPSIPLSARWPSRIIPTITATAQTTRTI